MDALECETSEGALRGRRGLPEMCAATVALCSFYYVRLMKERRRREWERRRRMSRVRRGRARERLRFAILWSSRLLREASAMSAGAERRGATGGAAIWSSVMEKAFTNPDWMESFRVTKPTFSYLCEQLRPALGRTDGGRRLPPETRLAITLLRLGSFYDFRTLEKIFGVSRPALHQVVEEVCEAVVSILAPRFISIPQGGALRDTVRDFEQRYGLPQLAGVLGAFHVAIRPPGEDSGRYFNTKGWHSVVLQAAVDSARCFWDLNVGSPGNVSGCQALLTSELFEWGTEGSLFPKTAYYVDGLEIPLHVLGPRSYPLLPWLMTPFSEEARPERSGLNRRFSSALSAAHGVFGHLKARWCCLVKRNDEDLSFLPTLIAACCTLHNICESRGDPLPERWLEEAAEEELEQPSECEEEELEPPQMALEIRNALASAVWAQNGGL